MCTPELSIIVYARGSAPVIGQTLESIQGQLFQDWECIVVDDGSADHTSAVVRRILEKDSRFVLFRQSFGGVAKARNRGFLESTPAAAYVAFIDAGDVWEPKAMGELIRCLEENPGAVGAHGLSNFMDREGRPLPANSVSPPRPRRLGYRNGEIVEWPSCEPTSFETLFWTEFLSPAGLFIARRTAYESVGLYDPSLTQCGLWDMTLRLSRLGPIHFLNRVVLYHRLLGASEMIFGKYQAADVRRLQRKTFLSAENSPEQRAVLREGWRAWQRFKIKEKWSRTVAGCMRGAPMKALKVGLELPLHAIDYIVGKPASLGF